MAVSHYLITKSVVTQVEFALILQQPHEQEKMLNSGLLSFMGWTRGVCIDINAVPHYLVTACIGYIWLKLTVVSVLFVWLVCFIVSTEEEVKWIQEDIF